MRPLIGLLAALAIAWALTTLRSSEPGSSPAAMQRTVDQQREALDTAARVAAAQRCAAGDPDAC